jgi:hypothetical protein
VPVLLVSAGGEELAGGDDGGGLLLPEVDVVGEVVVGVGVGVVVPVTGPGAGTPGEVGDVDFLQAEDFDFVLDFFFVLQAEDVGEGLPLEL